MASTINKSETWQSLTMSPLLIFQFWLHITFVGLAKKGLLKKTLILSGHDFLANWKRYSYAPLWVNSYLDLTMDFPTCHYRWPVRKKVGNVFWMIVFSLWPSKLRCPPMRTVLLKKRYRSQKPLWSAQMLSNIWKLWFFVISNKNVGDQIRFSSFTNLISYRSGKISNLMSGHEIYES